ncbi:MAG: GAF domain-containing protein, partial [Candidatus Eremiobacteraeota bacterium]|nr:GAF domain-containing protein [Candidatus Eremiobacteraeota bacterium]
MKNLTACRDSAELFQIALEQVADYVQPERAMLLTRSSPEQPLQLRAGLGVEKRNFETHGAVSFELLERVVGDGQPLMLEDACEDPRFRESSSVVLAGLKSVLCAPFKGTSGKVEGV